MTYAVIESVERGITISIPIILMGIIGITMLRYNVKMLKEEFKEDGNE